MVDRAALRARLVMAIIAALFTGVTHAADTPAPAPGDTYAAVAAEFARHDARLPGSGDLTACQQAISDALTRAGITVHRQTYDTLVPHINTCAFTVGGKAITPAWPLAPNGAANPTTWGHALRGPLVYVGQGSLGELDGKPIAGAIAVVEAGSSHFADVFTQGAQAVVVVGNDCSQWQMAAAFSVLPVALPRIYVPRDAARAAGLLDADGTQEATLDLAVTWQDVVGVNLWSELPATANSPITPAQLLVLSAETDSFGAVPACCPQSRAAANCALLAETLVRLAAQPRARPVMGLFTGSHWAAQDGMRQFYYVEERVRLGDRDTDPLGARIDFTTNRIAHLATQLAHLDQAPEEVLTSGDSLDTELFHALKDRLNGDLDALNHDYREALFAERDLERKISLPGQPAVHGPQDARDLAARQDAIKAEIARLAAAKHRTNVLMGEVAQGEIHDQSGFADLVAEVRAPLFDERTCLQRRLVHLGTDKDLLQALAGSVIAGHFTCDFASATAPWMFSPFGADMQLRTVELSPGTFDREINAYVDAWKTLPVPDGGWPAPLQTPSNTNIRFDALCTPHQRAVAAAVPITIGIPGFQMQTMGDGLNGDQMPDRQAVDLSNLAPAVAGLFGTIADSGDDLPHQMSSLPNQSYPPLLDGIGGSDDGDLVVDYAQGADEVVGPARNAVAVDFALPTSTNAGEAWYNLDSPAAVVFRIDPDGHLFVPLITDLPWGQTGNRIYGLGFDANGTIDRFTSGSAPFAKTRIGMVRGSGGGFFMPFEPADAVFSGTKTVVYARTDTAPTRSQFAWYRGLGVYFSPLQQPIKLLGSGIDCLGITDRDPMGAGVDSASAALLNLDPNRVSSGDYVALNRGRLDLLRAHDLIDRPLEQLQSEAEDHHGVAIAAHTGHQVRLGVAHDLVAGVLGHRIHQPLRERADDLVQAVIWLLLLCIPFAFCAERLLLGGTTVYRQIAGFGGIFLVIFVLLYLTHPAFALASAPIIIFLAFIIILLSGGVIAVVMSRFRHELLSLQGLSSKVHGGADGNGTALAAAVIGIAGMRNRPLKTFLTATTVALLTFTILVFASFSAEIGVVTSNLGPARGPDRIEYHLPSFLGLPDRLVDAITTIYGDRYQVCARGGSFLDPTGTNAGPTRDEVVNAPWNPKNQKTVELKALLVVDPAEIPHLDPLFAPLSATAAAGSAAASATAAAPLLLTSLCADQLGVAPGDTLMLRGQPFTVAGIFDQQVLKRLENIDGTKIVPPDFQATTERSHLDTSGASQLEGSLQNVDVSTFQWSSPELVAITTPAGMRNLRPLTNLITLYPRPGVAADLAADARDLAEILDGPVAATGSDGAQSFYFTTAIAGSGAFEVLVPLLLGGLIIFSSLMGSIVDRQKEIFTFSALGLGPIDVGVMFFAESFVFAVLGGMGGYLIGQIVAKLLSLLSANGVSGVPELNVSSLSSIITIGVVMVTVMLSTIYPALMASRSANPGVARKWRMPAPKGDNMTFTFPFTVSADQIAGILAFISEHFTNHGDASIGAFAAKETVLSAKFREGGGRSFAMSAEIALAPFDLGVLQRFSLTTRPSDIPGIDEVVVELERLNGPPGTWQRSNRGFIGDLRRQFLYWRSLSLETIEHYHAQAALVLGPSIPPAHAPADPLSDALTGPPSPGQDPNTHPAEEPPHV